MKRAEFFKRLGLGAAAVVVAPKAIAEALEEVKAPSAKIAEPWDVVMSKPKQQVNYNWHEEPRLHFKIKVEVFNKDRGAIKVKLPKDHKFRLHDVVMVGSETNLEERTASYLVTDVSIGYYSLTNNEHGSIVELTAYKMNNIPSIGDEVELMLIGNSYNKTTT